jgi:hydroxypyruvate isomerase
VRASAHISWLFAERPYLERIGAACDAGFQTIESAWPPQADDRARLPAAVAERRLSVALLNCPAGDVARGERGFLNDDSRRAEVEAGFAEALELAVAIGAPNVNVLVGRALPSVPHARQRSALVSALRWFAPLARARGVRVLLEPVNDLDSPGFMAPTPDAAVELIEAVGDDELGLLLDVYHVARAGDDPASAIERHAERIAHVQVADHPGRGAPGSGALAIWDLLEQLAARGYGGAIGFEYDAHGETERSLGFLREPRALALLG